MRRMSFTVPVRTLVLLGALSLSVYFLFALAQRGVQAVQLHGEEVRLEREVKGLEARHGQLEADRESLQTDADIEKIAREQLNLIKPGETAVIVVPSEAARARAGETRPEPAPPERDDKPWWQRLFRR